MALTAYTLVTFYARQVTTKAFSTPVDVMQTGALQSFSSGTGAYQISKIYYRTGTLSAAGTLTLNLKNSSLTDGLGNGLQFTNFKWFYLYNLSTKSNAILTLATFAGSSVRHFNYGYCSSPQSVAGRGAIFFSRPIAGWALGNNGTWIKLRAMSGTVNYNLIIAGM